MKLTQGGSNYVVFVATIKELLDLKPIKAETGSVLIESSTAL